MVDRLFDTLNSRNPHGKGFKQPLKNVNIPHWENSLETTAQYLLNLKSSSGQLLITHRPPGQQLITHGASVAKWLDYSPFTSKVTSLNPSSVLGPSPHVKRAQVNALRKVVGFLRVLRFPPLRAHSNWHKLLW